MVCHDVQGNSKHKLYYDKTQMSSHTPIGYNTKMVRQSYPRTHPSTGIGLDNFNRHFRELLMLKRHVALVAVLEETYTSAKKQADAVLEVYGLKMNIHQYSRISITYRQSEHTCAISWFGHQFSLLFLPTSSSYAVIRDGGKSDLLTKVKFKLGENPGSLLRQLCVTDYCKR